MSDTSLNNRLYQLPLSWILSFNYISFSLVSGFEDIIPTSFSFLPRPYQSHLLPHCSPRPSLPSLLLHPYFSLPTPPSLIPLPTPSSHLLFLNSPTSHLLPPLYPAILPPTSLLLLPPSLFHLPPPTSLLLPLHSPSLLQPPLLPLLTSSALLIPSSYSFPLLPLLNPSVLHLPSYYFPPYASLLTTPLLGLELSGKFYWR